MSTEFFFALVLFSLFLVWLNYFAGSTLSSIETRQLKAQETMLANDLASIAEKTGLYNVSTNFTLPCLVDGKGKTSYSIFFKDNGLMVFTGGSSLTQKNCSCKFEETLLKSECAGEKICVKQSSVGKINFSLGGC